MVELQNGCVCCSASDELFTNIDQLVQGGVSADGEPLFDHIVIECTGVAEPKMIRDKFQEMDKVCCRATHAHIAQDRARLRPP